MSTQAGSSQVKTNRHRATSGESWGWVEAPNGRHVLFWEGSAEREIAAARARELDAIGWENLTDTEVRHV